MTKYYKHIRSGSVYKFLFEAEDKSYYGFETREKIIDVVYEDLQGNKYTRQKEEFEKKFNPCNPPVDWRKLYEAAIFTCKRDSVYVRIKDFESVTYFKRLNKLEKFAEKRLNRYE